MLFVGSRLALNFHYTVSDCVKWYIFQEVGTLTLIAAVESVLIVRGVLFPCRFPECSFISIKYTPCMTEAAS